MKMKNGIVRFVESHSLTAEVARSGSSVCSVGTGHIESALRGMQIIFARTTATSGSEWLGS